jgi:hypothetical protein
MTQTGLLAEIVGFWRGLLRMVSDPYRPEQHYMRGARVITPTRRPTR